MIAFGTTLLALALWFVQGIGFVHWLAPDARQPSLVRWLFACWFGLVLEIVLLVSLYYVVPGLTASQLAWPVTVILAAGSLALYARSPHADVHLDVDSWIVIAFATFATLLVLRPLLPYGDLGFYYSNNGEFSNYAAMADAVQYHDAATETGGLAIVSREGVTGLVAGVFSTLTGRAALWIIEPIAAAFAALAFVSLGLLVRAIAARLSVVARAPIWLVYAWAIFSASSQCFFTLSFVSQYLSIALFFGGLAMLAHTRELAAWRRIVLLGALLGVLACVYPEMFVPSAGLVCAFHLAAAEPTWRARVRAVAETVAALVLAAVVANRLGLELLVERSGIGGGGWDIYGPHRPVLPFAANVLGFTNPFAAPDARSTGWAVAALVAVAVSIGHGVVRVRGETDPTRRGLSHLGWLFAAGVAGVFWLIAQRAMPTNYIAFKFLLGYGWLAFLALALALARLIEWRPRAAPLVAAAMIAVLVGLWPAALRFTKLLHRAESDALFLADDARTCREELNGRRAYVSAGWFNYAIIGQFIAHDRDLLAVNGTWPDGTGQLLEPHEPILLLGAGRKLADDPFITAPYHERCRGRGFVLLEPD